MKPDRAVLTVGFTQTSHWDIHKNSRELPPLLPPYISRTNFVPTSVTQFLEHGERELKWGTDLFVSVLCVCVYVSVCV